MALQNRGGIGAVRRHSRGHLTHFGFRFQIEGPQLSADYAFEIAAKSHGAFEVKRERCLVEYTLGELLRMGEMVTDSEPEKQPIQQLNLFRTKKD